MGHAPLRSPLIALLLIFSLVCSVLGLQADHASVVDWHRPLIGHPLVQPTPPTFVESSVLGKQLIVATTRKNILSVLDLQGNLVWRQAFEDSDPVISYHVNESSVLLLSGPSAATARLFSLHTGQLLWEHQLLENVLPHLANPSHLGTDAIFVGSSIIILSDGRRVTKLNAATGAVQWAWEFPGAGSTNLFKQLMVLDNDLYVISLTSSFATPTMSHLSLNLSSVFPVTDLSHIQSSIKNPEDAHIACTVDGRGVRAVSTEFGRVRVTPLLPDGTVGTTKDHLPGGGKRYARLIDIGLRSHGYLLAQMENGAVVVLEIGDEAKPVAEFDGSRDVQNNAAPVYSASKSPTGFLITRLFYSFAQEETLVQTIIIEPGRVQKSINSIPFDMSHHGVTQHAAVASNLDQENIPTLLLTTSTGAVQLFNGTGIAWTREESLADIVAVQFVDLGEPETEEVFEIMEEETLFGRTTRHVRELKQLPEYISRFLSRIASSTVATRTPPLSFDRLHRDRFGFQKLLVVVTKGGKIFALDSANGNIIWTRNLGYFSDQGPELDVHNMWMVRELNEAGNPLLAIVAVRSRKENVATLAFQVDAFTGEIIGEKDSAFGVPLGKVLFTGRPKTAFLTSFENCDSKSRVLVVVDNHHNLHLFPKCETIAAKVESMAPHMFFSVIDHTLEGTSLRGFIPSVKTVNMSLDTIEVWARHFPAQTGVQIKPMIPSVTSSFGRALGDKSVLYKYLNPHLTVVSTVSPLTSIGHVYVIDTTTGATIHEVQIDDVEPNTVVQVAMVENWLVYAWLEPVSDAGSGGWRLGSVELYEDRADENVDSLGSSTITPQFQVKALSQSFLIGSDINALTFTSSKFGVAAKELVYVNSRGQVVSLPRRLLDPRRPKGTLSKEEKEEMLVPYDSLLPHEPKRIISHRYPTLGIKHIVSSPSLLESTPLLFAHGVDLFATRGLTPSGTFDILSDGFNKVQLLLTLAALGIGVAIAKPAVNRLALRAKWF